MSGVEIAALSFVVFLVLVIVRVPIALAMLVCGVVGTTIVTGSERAVLASFKSLSYSTFGNYTLTIVPLFLLMGQLASRGGLSESLFRAANAFLGHRRGGLAMAAIGASAGFGAVSGSSIATAATMGRVAMPEMRRFGYAGSLSTGSLAAGGTLGILIPPSFVLVIYAILAEQNIVKLFIAAIVPGLLAALGYMITISIVTRLRPGLAPRQERASWPERMRALIDVWPVLALFVIVIGGIYWGWFSPTEAAAVGAVATGAIVFFQGRLSWRGLLESLRETAVSTGMIFFIVLGASAYNTFLAFAGLPNSLADFVLSTSTNPFLIVAVILVIYLVLGCVMDSLSMILLTVPIFFPLVQGLDFGLTPDEAEVWFGILVLIAVEVGLITPPVGMNLFIINSMSEGVPITQTYRGVLPFVVSDIIRTGVLLAFPVLTLGLVRLLF